METLFERHDQYMKTTPISIVREAIGDIHWGARLVAIAGARGVGKSTLMRQYLKLNYGAFDRSVLYCTMDSSYFATHTILDFVSMFVMNGGKRLMLDEIHKYTGWSREIKEIYDLYPDLNIVISGSSLLEILNADADLSRRCLRYTLNGLSFREFLQFYKGICMERYSLEDILGNPGTLCAELNEKCRPVQCFKEYLKYGYYPFYLEGTDDYYPKIEQVTNFVIDAELPLLRKVEVSNVRKIKALVSIIASSVPYEVDASKLSRSVGAGRDTIIEYLRHLSDARIFNLLYSGTKSIGKLTKPDKIYLENSNLLYAMSASDVKIGTARETFAVCQLKNSQKTVEYGKTRGDLKVNERFTFEIGGKDKDFSQIAGIPDSFVLADDMEFPMGHKLPLWLIGFLY